MRLPIIAISAAAFLGSLLPSKSDEPPTIGSERYRPRYHFTAEKGYINDPNGLFFLDGTYHLFFQHDDIRNKKWGHATSTDLLHWTHLPDAITPINEHPVFSGSAAIDHLNTTGFGTKENPPIVACFTEWGIGQSLAYSINKGKTWTRHAGNPVLKRPGDEHADFALSSRDPHIMWDAPRKRWVLVMFDNLTQKPERPTGDRLHGFSIFTSPNLKDWTYRSHLDDFYVCPDVFQLPVEGSDKLKWVAMDWERYTIGEFDGEKFTSEQEIIPLDYGPSQLLSANQSWKHLPDGRTIQICWIRDGKYPDMPFTQQLSIPTELTLRRIGDRFNLCKNPIRELKTLRGPTTHLTQLSDDGINIETETQSHDLEIDVSLNKGDAITLTILGKEIILEPNKVTAMGLSANLNEALTHVRILSDITTIEVFANHGERTITHHLLPPAEPQAITIRPTKGKPTRIKGTFHELRSVWK